MTLTVQKFFLLINQMSYTTTASPLFLRFWFCYHIGFTLFLIARIASDPRILFLLYFLFFNFFLNLFPKVSNISKILYVNKF